MSKYADQTDAIVTEIDDTIELLKQAMYTLGGAERREATEGALDAIHTARAMLDAAERRTVALMRSSGTTWQEIADTLGTTRQSAHERFSRTSV